MNEQIKKLLAECYNPYGEFRYQQFAEGMIDNCIQLLINNGYTDAAKCISDIHYGISDAP